MTGDRMPLTYQHFVADPPSPTGGEADDVWTEAARATREAADELGRLQRLVSEHWRSGRDRDHVDDRLRRLVHRLDEAHDATRQIATALVSRAAELAEVRRTIREVVDEARSVGLVVASDGTVGPQPGSALPPLPVRALAARLTTRITEATARAAGVETRTAALLAAVPPPL
ncbi:hypothetical protein [Micromonospora sp. NPDC049799]|uniref:hypothetical protein n=1 Tax=Micromonospora sp. NPDC049799 TaxID=3154741 RepID=UPI0033C8258E